MRRILNWSFLVLVIGIASSALALDAGSRAPAIGLVDLHGKMLNLDNLKGKVVVVDFWASWCAPCKEELPVLEKLYGQYKGKGLEIVGVNIDTDADNMKDFLKRQKLSFTVVPDAKRVVADRYKPSKMPSSFILDKKGIVRFAHAGFKASDEAVFKAEIEKLLAE